MKIIILTIITCIYGVQYEKELFSNFLLLICSYLYYKLKTANFDIFL